jgi:hypothetical protein
MKLTIVGAGNMGRAASAREPSREGRARRLEQLGFLHIAVQQPLDLGFGSAIKLHS